MLKARPIEKFHSIHKVETQSVFEQLIILHTINTTKTYTMEKISLGHFYIAQKILIRNIIEEIIKDNADLEKIEKIFVGRHNYIINDINENFLMKELYNDMLNSKGASIDIIDPTQDVTPLIQKFLTKWTNIIHKIEEILSNSTNNGIPLNNLEKKYVIMNLLL